MIPIQLTLSGFLSYRDPVEIDFTTFDLACISGSNGAGKSSLLDAITWALFGQARKRDDSLIHSNPQVKAAEVRFTFEYEGNIYRIQRTNPRNKTNLLEFHILQNSREFDHKDRAELYERIRSSRAWKPLTEHSTRETQARIEQTLRLDYETFVNASFFLQGKADQFTQQRPGDRKRILGSILGLEAWESYRQEAAERRKDIEQAINNLEGRLKEINAELAEEDTRKARLKELQANLEQFSRLRLSQETLLESIRKVAATLAEQRRLVETLQRQAEAAARRLVDLQERRAGRQTEKSALAVLMGRSDEIKTAYANWQQARQELEQWEETAARFREQEKRRQGPLNEIHAEQARLQQELSTLESQHSRLQEQAATLPDFQGRLASEQETIARLDEQLRERTLLEQDLQAARQRLADARAENPRLRVEMDDLKVRIAQLRELDSPLCPLCGQPLSAEDRSRLMEELASQGKEKGDRFRANKALLDQADLLVKELESKVIALSQAESELRLHARLAEQLAVHIQHIESLQAAWEADSAPVAARIRLELEQETYCPEARSRLAEIDAELKITGYDAGTHDAVRRSESGGRSSETELRELEKAQSALAALERDTTELASQQVLSEQEAAHQQGEYQAAARALEESLSQAPDLNAAEREFFNLKEQENRLRGEEGAASQKVQVLKDLKQRRKSLEAERDGDTQQVAQYKLLEKAFGKDGVPALLIEQALPEIETKANEILERLSNGSMSVKFRTQADYKDKNRDDKKETLDILISDSSGTRDYELFSGGEAFRVNFAIRLALSEVLAQRAGARLQTLVIDEGFGSQDAQGRQRLIEAINLVRQDFAKILVITHIDELKDAFPTRIEVEKTARGSMVRVVSVD